MSEYRIKVNGVDMTNYLQGIAPIQEKKKIEKKVIKPEYELTFFWDNWLIPDYTYSPFANVDYTEFKIEFYEKITEDTVFEGNIKSIQPDGNNIKIIVGFTGDEKIDRKILTSYIDYNPIEIIKLIADSLDLTIEQTHYKYMKSLYAGIKGSVIADDNTTFLSVLQDIAEKFALQIYFSKNKIYMDTLDPLLIDNTFLEIDDNDVLDVKFERNDFQSELFTNYVFVCEDEGDVELTDEDGYNYGKLLRSDFGDIPYDKQDGGTGQVIRIKDADSGHLSLVNYVKHHGREYLEIDITLDLRKFNAFRLDTVFIWDSDRYNFKKRFEIFDIVRDTEKKDIKIKARELEDEENKSITSGYGFDYGNSYGEV